jgi:transposase
MAPGRKTALTLRLTPRERLTLMAWQRSTTITLGRARRARLILLLADGMPITHIAQTVGISRRFVYKWAQRFLEEGVEGLADRPTRGSWPRASRPGVVHPDERRAYGISHTRERDWR